MNPSAIIMLVIILLVFFGGIGFCISRVGKSPQDETPDKKTGREFTTPD